MMEGMASRRTMTGEEYMRRTLLCLHTYIHNKERLGEKFYQKVRRVDRTDYLRLIQIAIRAQMKQPLVPDVRGEEDSGNKKEA